MADEPYDPLPDIASALRAIYFAQAHSLPAEIGEAFCRLARKLRFDTKDIGPMAGATEIEAALRQHL